MAFSFGTPATNSSQQNSTPSFSFGTSAPGQSASLFGGQQNTSNPTTNSFSFGNTNASQQTQAAPVQSGFSFGNASTGNNAPSVSFGGLNNNNTQQSSTGGLFGSNTQNQNTNSNLFGQNTQAQNTNTNIFGQNTPAQNVNPNLFGQQSNSNVPSSGLFGQSTIQTTSNPNNPAANGQTNNTNFFANNSVAGGLFGQSNVQQPQQNSLFGNAFGTQNAHQNNQAQNPQLNQNQQLQHSQALQPTLAQSVYGQTLNQPQFSWSRPAQNLGQSSMPSFGLGSSSLAQSKFNPRQTYSGDQTTSITNTQSAYGPSQPASIQDQLMKLKNAWDPTHPDCMFQAYFYNRVAPETASLYTKPDDHKQAAWEEAVASRPDNSVVPVLGRGFTDLQSRVKGQEQQIHAYRTRVHEIADKLKELDDRHLLHATPKIENARRRHMELSRRALMLAAKVQVIRCRGYALRPEEEQLRNKLKSLNDQLHDPGTFGRVDEIWAKMILLKRRQEAMEEEIKVRGYYSAINFDEGDGLQNIEQVLQDHNNGLQYVSSIVRTDLEKIEAEIQKFQSSKSILDKSAGVL